MYESIEKMIDQNQKRLECEIEKLYWQYRGLFEIYANHSPLKIIPFWEFHDVFYRSDSIKNSSYLNMEIWIDQLGFSRREKF